MRESEREVQRAKGAFSPPHVHTRQAQRQQTNLDAGKRLDNADKVELQQRVVEGLDMLLNDLVSLQLLVVVLQRLFKVGQRPRQAGAGHRLHRLELTAWRGRATVKAGFEGKRDLLRH